MTDSQRSSSLLAGLVKVRAKVEPDDGGVTLALWVPRELAIVIPGLVFGAVAFGELNAKKIEAIWGEQTLSVLIKKFMLALDGKHSDAQGNEVAQ